MWSLRIAAFAVATSAYSGAPVFLLIFPSRALKRSSAYLSAFGSFAGSTSVTPLRSALEPDALMSSSEPIKMIFAIPSFTIRLAASTTRLSSPSQRTIVFPAVLAFVNNSSTNAIKKPSLKELYNI